MYIFFFVNLCDTINLLGDWLQGTCFLFGFIARFSLSAYCLRRRTLTQRLVDVEWRPRLSRRTFPQICREPFETVLTALLGARDLLATATDAYILCSVALQCCHFVWSCDSENSHRDTSRLMVVKWTRPSFFKWRHHQSILWRNHCFVDKNKCVGLLCVALVCPGMCYHHKVDDEISSCDSDWLWYDNDVFIACSALNVKRKWQTQTSRDSLVRVDFEKEDARGYFDLLELSNLSLQNLSSFLARFQLENSTETNQQCDISTQWVLVSNCTRNIRS